MKHIFDKLRTGRYLETWAGNAAPMCLATFFFWDSGTPEQKSPIGFLRAILFQVLEQHPDFIPIAFPDL
jgi:hypothetical protein